MPTQYETNFIIQSTDDLAGMGLLHAITEAIERELQSGDGAADYELETNRVGAVGYAHFSGERSHPSQSATVRLDARLCTLDETPDIAVQILTRFISADGKDLLEQPAGPPRLLNAITGKFRCNTGCSEIGNQPVELKASNIEAFAREHMFNSERTLPILLITQNSIDPERAQRVLQGVAQVAYCSGNTDQALMQHTGIRTYGGAVRIYWPGCQPGQNRRPPPGFKDFYMPSDVRRPSFLYEAQKACLANEPGTDFDTLFSSARTTVILERNHQLEEQSRAYDAVAEPEDSTKIAELERAKRTAEVRGNEMNRRLQTAQRSIEQLEREKEESQEIISSLKEELDELSQGSGNVSGEGREERNRFRRQYEDLRARTVAQEKTIVRLNDDNQRLRQRERTRDSADGRLLRLGPEHLGNITIMNHALNIFRDPCRKFIVRRLRSGYGHDLTDALGKSIEFRDNQRRTVTEHPEEVFDIGDFSAIVASNWECFDNWQSLSRKMDEVRHIRNRASHPPTEGFNKDRTQDSLRIIIEALEYLDDRESEECVAEIRELVEVLRSI